MSFNRPLKFLASLLIAVSVASILNVAVTKTSFSESYPAVVCPPTLSGLSSQISLSSQKTPFQRLQNRSTTTQQVKVLRLPVSKDSLILNSEKSTPVVWQSRAGSWAGGVLCTSSTSSQWFVGGTSDITTRGRLIVVNSGLSDAVVDIQTFTENGKQPLKTINVPSKNYTIFSTDTLAPGDKSLVVQVVPRSGRINAFLIDERGKGLKSLGGDLINPSASTSRTVVIPVIPHQFTRNTPASPHIVRVLTPGDVSADISIELVSADGVFIPVGFTSRSISAGVVTELTLAPNIASKIFAIRLISSEPVVAAVKSTAKVNGRQDFVWSTATPALSNVTMSITGLVPLVVFTGDSIDVSLDVTSVKGKLTQQRITGNDIVSWKAPEDARSFTITKVGPSTFAGALVSSVNGYGYFPILAGSALTKIETPDSNIRVLNP